MPRKAKRQQALALEAAINNPHLQTVLAKGLEYDSQSLVDSSRTIVNRRQVQLAYNNYIELAYPDLIGKEWVDTKEHPLEDRAHHYLSLRVHASRGRYGTEDKPEHMTFRSLMTLRWTFLWLLLENSGVPRDHHQQWTDLTFEWCKGLQRRYGLRTLPIEKNLFGALEVRLMIEEALTNPPCYENALQHVTAIIIELCTGLRPSSLFVCPPYTTCLKNGAFLLRHNKGVCQIQTDVQIDVFKGYSDIKKSITFSLRPPEDRKNYFMYLAPYVIGTAIRRGDLEASTVEEVLAGETETIHWKNPELPFFRAAQPRGLSVSQKPMNSQGHRDYLHKIAGAVGIDGDRENSAVPYNFRHNFATTLLAATDMNTARKAMGHRADSNAIAEIYDDGNRRVDFMGIISGEGKRGNQQEGRSTAVYRAPINVAPLDIDELVAKEPIISILLKQAENLHSCLALGSGDGWKELVYDQDTISKGDTPLDMYLWTLKRLKKVTANTQAKHVRESQAMALRDQRRDMTRAERLKRLAELGKPSTLTAILAAARSEMIRKKFPNLGRHEDDDDEEDEEATPVIMVDPPRVQEEDGDDEGTDQDYKELRQMMINLATLKEAKSAAVFCLQCLDDPTCSEANRRKDFFFESKLRVHETNFHSPGKRCARFLKSCDCERKTENGARYFLCAWCGSDDPDIGDYNHTFGSKRFFHRSYLIRHIVECHTREDMAAAEYNIIAAVASNDTSRAYDVTEDGLVADTETLDDLTCEECFYDPSLPKERRHHRFKDANGKRSHLKTKIHRPEARLIRMLKRDAAPHKYKLWACPYCDDFLGSSPAEVCHHVVDGDCTTSLADDVLDIYDTFINGVGPSLSEQEQNEMVRLVFADLVDDRPVLVEPSVMSGSASGIADWMDTERQHAIQYWDAAVETPGNLDELFGAIDGSLLLTPDVDQPMPDV